MQKMKVFYVEVKKGNEKRKHFLKIKKVHLKSNNKKKCLIHNIFLKKHTKITPCICSIIKGSLRSR